MRSYFAAFDRRRAAGATKGNCLRSDSRRRRERESSQERHGGQSPLWSTSPLAPAIARIASGSFRHRDASSLRASGYVVHTLEAALWAFHETGTFRDGALLAVNLGEDADTTGAVYGQLAGAYYGIDAIPADWRARLARRDEIVSLATALYEHAHTAPSAT
jgi:hypothetical protein